MRRPSGGGIKSHTKRLGGYYPHIMSKESIEDQHHPTVRVKNALNKGQSLR